MLHNIYSRSDAWAIGGIKKITNEIYVECNFVYLCEVWILESKMSVISSKEIN